MENTNVIKRTIMKYLPALVVALGALSAIKPACAWVYHQPEMPNKLRELDK